MSKFKWVKNPAATWGRDVEVRTPRGEVVYKHPTRETIYTTAREALYCGRLELRGETPTFDEQLNLLAEVLTLIEQKKPIPLVGVKLFGGNRVLLDFYLSWLRSHFLARPDDEPDQWVLSIEAKSILLMLRQTGCTVKPAKPVQQNPAEATTGTSRRRVMMDMTGG